MWPSVVVEADPVSDDAGGVLEAFKAVPVDTLFLQRTDDALDHAVLLRAVRGDKLLAKSIASDELGVGPAGKNQPVVASKQERLRNPAECSKPGDKRLLECAAGRRCFAGSREVPAEQFAGVAVHHERQGRPLVAPRPETGKGCCQSNANPSPLFAGQQVLHNEKFAPFAKGGVS